MTDTMSNAHNLAGRRVAFLLTDGVEQVELTGPWEAVQDAGGMPVLISPRVAGVQAYNHLDKGDVFAVEVALADANHADYEALVLPGGVVNADHLRQDPDAVAFTRAFFEHHKPVAAICHAPWILAEADVLRGRDVTSYPSLKTDLVNAGASWTDVEVVVDNGLVTSRTPDDLPAFCAKMLEEIAEGDHAGQTV